GALVAHAGPDGDLVPQALAVRAAGRLDGGHRVVASSRRKLPRRPKGSPTTSLSQRTTPVAPGSKRSGAAPVGTSPSRGGVPASHTTRAWATRGTAKRAS